jgi:hypothetical protein
MFLQQIQEINAVFDEETILSLIHKAVESEFYEIKYEKYELINAEFVNTEDGKPLVKVKYQKILKTIDKNVKEETNF